MRPFRYARAADVGDAVARYRPGTAYLGGGTNLVDLMRLGVVAPDQLIDVTGATIKGVFPLPNEPRRVFIGAATRNSDVAAHPAVRELYPMLARALVSGASGQVRNMATVGGNLLQRTRCPYFQDTSMACGKRHPGSGCQANAPGADTENLAILGHSPSCRATHPSDMAVALTALGATVHVTGPAGDRQIPMPGLHRLPGREPERDTVLDDGELITVVELPPPPPGRQAYRKVRDRASFAFALVSVAAAIDVGSDGRIGAARLALGGVAHAPWRCQFAEGALAGASASRAAFERAADAELLPARPLPGNEYKVRLARNLITATLEELAAPGGAGPSLGRQP
jgi:xanthine dehydrogenase YagS FAD-binding subunit